jgi:hypothetical protein
LYDAFDSELDARDESVALDPNPPELMELVVAANVGADLMSFEEALAKVDAEASQAIAQHFNGELSSVRAIDSQDCLF